MKTARRAKRGQLRCLVLGRPAPYTRVIPSHIASPRWASVGGWQNVPLLYRKAMSSGGVA